jgi:hypothetical protein
VPAAAPEPASRALFDRPPVRPALTVFTLAVVAFLFSPTAADPDLWGHLRFGLDFWRDGLARVDRYSYVTAGQPWINHEWLAEAVMALAWTAGGAAGLNLLKVAMTLVAAAAVLRHLAWRGVPAVDGAIVVLYGALFMVPWLGSVRPQVFTYAAFALLLALVARAERGDVRPLWGAVPLMAVWANLHGGFLAGAGVLALWWAASAAAGRLAWGAPGARPVPWRALPPVVCAVAATLLTPYGPGLWIFLRTALVPRREIAEWNPVDTTGLEGLVLGALLGSAALAWIRSRRERSPALGVVLLATAVAPFVARRHTPLFALAAMVLAGEHLADLARRLAERLGGAPEPPGRGRRLAVALWAGAAAFAAAAAIHVRQIHYEASDFPVRAVQALKRAGVGGDMITFFDWGEYVIWHLGPGVRVSMDGRRETVYPDDVYRESLAFLYGVGRWDALLDRGRPALALVSRGFAAYNLLRCAPGWTVIVEDDHSALFARAGSPQAARLRAVGLPPPPQHARLPFP